MKIKLDTKDYCCMCINLWKLEKWPITWTQAIFTAWIVASGLNKVSPVFTRRQGFLYEHTGSGDRVSIKQI